MADQKLTDRNEITNPTDDDYLYIVQNGVSYKIKKKNLISDDNGNQNTLAGEFTGEFDVSTGGTVFYEDKDSGGVVNLSLSASKAFGSMATVRVKGSLTGSLPETWNFSGQPLTNLASRFNELSLLYVNDSDVRIVNRVIRIVDTEKPSVPTGVASSNEHDTYATITWNASTDNIEVFDYLIKVDGVINDTTTELTSIITGLDPESTYTVTVIARDESGNESDPSVGINVTTTASVEYNPLSNLPNLHVWALGSINDSDMTLNGSNGVTQLVDKAGNFTFTNYLIAPEFITDHIVFNESGALFDSNGSDILTATEDFHGFLIFKNTNTKPADFITNNNGSSRFGISYRSGSLSVGYYNGSFTSKSTPFNDTDSFHKLEFKNASGVITALLDDVEMTGTEAFFSDAIENFIIGGDSQQTDRLKSMNFKDFFVNEGEMTSTERSNMISYLFNKYGI